MGIQGHRKVPLTKESVLQKITEYDIFKMYMPNKNWKFDKITNSPFRKDDNPSFIIGNRGGALYFIDFADTNLRGNCFNFVEKLYGFNNLDQALKIIDRDFGLGLTGDITNTEVYKKIKAEYQQPEELGKRYASIQVSVRKFTHEELAYWNEYHQDISDLRREHIYSIDKLFLNRQRFSLKETELRFGYFYDGHWKIYKPFADPKFKWVPNNVPITTMDGMADIKDCDTAFITKSKKDYMVVKKLFPTVCAVQNEGIACFSPENVDYIKSNSKKQILSFDSDVTGVENSKQITDMFGFDYFNVPRSYLSDGIKDWALLAKDYGMPTLEKIFKRKKLL